MQFHILVVVISPLYGYFSTMHHRHAEASVRAALRDTRVVLLQGARQTGKSTLAQHFATSLGGKYLTLDDATTLAAARTDTQGFVHSTTGLTIIDEVQLAPELFPAIKLAVDADKRPGRFLLTGSANVLSLPTLSESLAGRMELVSLAPLAEAELEDATPSFVDWLWRRSAWPHDRHRCDRLDVCKRIVAGGFPEARARTVPHRRDAWFRSYVTTLVRRDIRDLARIDGLVDLPRLLALMAARVSGLVNVSDISRSSGIGQTSLRRYWSLLEAIFLVDPLPAWAANLGKRLVKSAKLHLVDTGLTAHLRGESDAAALAKSNSLGPLLESFVVQELRKQAAWSTSRPRAYHYRTATGQEVDLVLERADRSIAAIEIKASSTLDARDAAGLVALREAAGKDFMRGVVIYLGERVVPLGDRLVAVPVSGLWA